MILIADSGSTKTMWKCTDGAGRVASTQTAGINPYYNNYEQILNEIVNARRQLSPADINEIHFYGAGCSTDGQKDMVARGLRQEFGAQKIAVYSDLLGAARALFQTDPGIVCILGTGSGSCIYDGSQIIKSIPSLGFILGDEGSGAFLGKQFVRDFLREDMPSELYKKAKAELEITKEIVLRNVNQEPMPSRYLAGFSKFIYDNIDQTYMNDLVYNSFNEFVREYVVRYENFRKYKIGFLGSIALKYQKVLREVLADQQISLSKIEDNPIDGLIEYHIHQFL